MPPDSSSKYREALPERLADWIQWRLKSAYDKFMASSSNPSGSSPHPPMTSSSQGARDATHTPNSSAAEGEEPPKHDSAGFHEELTPIHASPDERWWGEGGQDWLEGWGPDEDGPWVQPWHEGWDEDWPRAPYWLQDEPANVAVEPEAEVPEAEFPNSSAAEGEEPPKHDYFAGLHEELAPPEERWWDEGLQDWSEGWGPDEDGPRVPMAASPASRLDWPSIWSLQDWSCPSAPRLQMWSLRQLLCQWLRHWLLLSSHQRLLRRPGPRLHTLSRGVMSLG